MSNSEIVDDDIDLVYSPDDGGYYFQSVCGSVSKIYNTKNHAMRTYRLGSIKWD